MKTVVGINLDSTQYGKQLKDGAACVIEDGTVSVAIAEERVTRQKYAGGFTTSLRYCLDYIDQELSNVDVIAVSTCCEDLSFREIKEFQPREQTKVHFVSHHLSHAYSAFCVSPFEEALIIVMDGGGNVLGSQTSSEWWKHRREQNTYYLGEGKTISLIGRDFDEPLDVGFGEAYRLFTYYLGWPSSVHAGTVMSLAGYGDIERYKDVSIFEFDGTHIRNTLENDPLAPIDVLKKFDFKTNAHFGEPRTAFDPIEQRHYDLACLIQTQLENALIAKINYLCTKTKVRNLCIAGGVGLNCLANSQILQLTPIENIFIQPAAGDQGQALGNALYAYHHVLDMPRSYVMSNAYLGKEYIGLDTTYIENLIRNKYNYTQSNNVASDTAQILSQGYVVAWFQGKSEYGPRALGNRSILADPRSNSIKQRLDNLVKSREPFRPYAPSVLAEFASEFFHVIGDNSFMTLACHVKTHKAALIPAVVHVDMSARLQTVSKNQNPLFHNLLTEFMSVSRIPLLLNTSFNNSGMPIVETPEDAFSCFDASPGIDALVIDEYIIVKRNVSLTNS